MEKGFWDGFKDSIFTISNGFSAENLGKLAGILFIMAVCFIAWEFIKAKVFNE
jgi:TRAP-type mannitol/chloroaromatic compound transport system permease small subunit